MKVTVELTANTNMCVHCSDLLPGVRCANQSNHTLQRDYNRNEAGHGRVTQEKNPLHCIHTNTFSFKHPELSKQFQK